MEDDTITFGLLTCCRPTVETVSEIRGKDSLVLVTGDAFMTNIFTSKNVDRDFFFTFIVGCSQCRRMKNEKLKSKSMSTVKFLLRLTDVFFKKKPLEKQKKIVQSIKR